MLSPYRPVPSRLVHLIVAAGTLNVATASGFARQDGNQADTAGGETGRADVGTFAFEIRDEATGAVMPGRVTFVGAATDGGPIFTRFDVRPNDLAVRDNVVYTLSGAAVISLPAGAYDVYASRGIEWSVARVHFEMRPGRSVAWAADLQHEVDTTGWMSGDFHLHTLTHSGHGDSNMPERIISLVGEGVEFAVATDHNHHTDYQPTIAVLGAAEELTAVTGNEVSVPIGHFNSFPLSPERELSTHFDDANELFAVLRAEPNAFDIEPVVQVNHPRWEGIDYFNIAGLDAVTAEPRLGTWSDDFDTLEILNEGAGWGYYEPGVDNVITGDETHSVLHDWFNLLNIGRRHFAVGNSDSHTVAYAFAGYPRNYVRTGHDDPARIDVPSYTEAIKAGRMFTTTGPFIELEINGAGMGESVVVEDGHAMVTVRVRAARWIDCDRVYVVVNGERRTVGEIADQAEAARTVERFEKTFPLELDHDAWIVVLVEGDDPMEPIVFGGDRPVRPLAISNPIWVDADDDDRWTSPADHAAALMATADDAATARRAMDALTPAERGLALTAAARTARPFAVELTRASITSGDRAEQLHALRAAEALRDPSLGPALWQVIRSGADQHVHVAAMRALATCVPDEASGAVFAFMESDARSGVSSTLMDELVAFAPGAPVREWMVLGYFAAPEAGVIAQRNLGPETDGDVSRSWPGRDGKELTWQARDAGGQGYLDLRGLRDDPALEENAAAVAQCWIHAETEREVAVMLGSDDGCRVYVNRELMYENIDRKSADPFEHLARWRLEPGWNRVVFAVENGTGGFGLYLRVMDDGVRFAREPER